MRKARLLIIVGLLFCIANTGFAQTAKLQKVPNWAISYAEDGIVKRVGELNKLILDELTPLVVTPVKVDIIMWSDSKRLDAFIKAPNCIACVVTDSNGINYMFLNNDFRYIWENDKAGFDNVLAHEILHLYVGIGKGHGGLWGRLADYLTESTSLTIKQYYD